MKTSPTNGSAIGTSLQSQLPASLSLSSSTNGIPSMRTVLGQRPSSGLTLKLSSGYWYDTVRQWRTTSSVKNILSQVIDICLALKDSR